MKDRISTILREEGMTATKFAEEVGVQASSISHILSGRNKPSTDFLVKILDRFRGINAEWLLLGKGDMFKNGNPNNYEASSPSINTENDLFSSKIAENPEFPSNNSEELSNKYENSEEILNNDDNFSSESGTNVKSEIRNLKPSKTVDKIVIFFTDNSFESYSPNK